MFANTCYRIAISSVVVTCAFVIYGNASFAEELKVLYRNDSELTASLPDSTLDWVTVSKSGSLIERKVELSEIKSLTLSRGRSSELLAKVRLNITRLGDADYLVREEAESMLALQGGQFKNLLKRMEDSPSMEVRHRAGRLLKGFSKRVFSPLSLDTLILSDGRTLVGEARNFSLAGQYRDAEISLDRSRVAQLSKVNPNANEAAKPKGDQHNGNQADALVPSAGRVPVATTIFHRHTDFNQPNQREFTFETDANDEPFRDRANIDAAFTDNGLLFRNEQTGYVGVSVFSFKYEGLPVGGRSVCLYGQGRSRRQFQGFMEIRFCIPGKPNQPAGVKEVGTFIARVKHSRDIVMEAYNAHGDVLATVEATDQQCVFAGVKSNELITRLRIFSSPWLKKLSRKIDVDFAIDTLRMSEPIAVQAVAGLPKQAQRVELTNGDRFSPKSINTTVEGDLRVYVSGVSKSNQLFTVKQNELASIQFSSAVVAPATNVKSPPWKAMLEDGSVVRVSPGKTMKSELLDDSFSLDDLVALWQGSSPARYPIEGDWKSDQAVVVFPTCRIQSDPFELSDRAASWTVKNKIQQTLMLGREDPTAKENQEDPTPSESSFDYAKTNPVQPPTFWNRQPLTIAPGRETGVVELADGQRFLFGNGKSFQFDSLKNRQIRLTWMEENPVNIPLKSVRAIIFPK